MNNVSVTSTINAPSEEIWNTVRSFGGVERYLPIVKSSIVHGSGENASRTCAVQFGEKEAEIVEKIDTLDDQQKRLQFSVVDAPPPFKGAQLNIQVKALDEKRSELTVGADLTNEQAQMMQGVFQMIASGLKKLHEEEKS